MITLSILFMVLSIVQAGPGDTVDDLKIALGNLNLNHSFLYAPVETVEGNVPQSLEGTLARHGCGVFGNSAEKFDNSFVDRIDHLFDCIEIDQTFSFYDGKAYFSSRFYDSNIARIFRDIYDQVLSVNLTLVGMRGLRISSGLQNLMKTYHSEANTSGITKIAL